MDDIALAAHLDSLGPWYHSIKVTDRYTTPGKVDPKPRADLALAHVPADLTGRKVLDLGGNAGGVAIEFARRGAHALVWEQGGRYVTQGRELARILGIPLDYWQGSVYDLAKHPQTWDYVIGYGLIYHLRHPFTALDLMRQATGERLFLSARLNASTSAVWGMSNVRGNVPDDTQEAAYNWWLPSLSAMEETLNVYGWRGVQLMEHDTSRAEGFWTAVP